MTQPSTVIGRVRLPFVCFYLWSLFLLPVWAHDPGLSNVDVKLESNRLTVLLVYNYVDIEGAVLVDKNLDRTITPEEFTAAKSLLEDLARNAIIMNIDGAAVQPSEVQVRIAKAEDGRDTAYFSLVYPGTPSSSLIIKSNLMD